LFAGLEEGLRAAAAEAVRDLRAGRLVPARHRFERILAQAPGDPDLLRLTGMTQRMSGLHREALATLERAREVAPGDALVASSLGLALIAEGCVDAGLAELERACELAPQAAALWANLGKARLDDGQARAAMPSLVRALDLQADLDGARFSLARAFAVSGEADAAASQYRILLQRRPADGEAWAGLAMLKSRLLGEADMAAMRDLLAGSRVGPEDRIAIHFALGEALHDQGRYPQAFAAWSEANAQMRKRLPWSADGFSLRVDSILARPWPVAAFSGERPRAIFLVGLPRSGSSLTEQILAMHPYVVARGESDVMSGLFQALAAGHDGTLAEALAAQSPADWQRIGAEYLERARRGSDERQVLVDKRLGNWLYAGPILRMLPDARVILCRRDPVETTFSCWRHRFAGNSQGYSYDFASLARYWHDFDRACRHWKDSYPGRVMEFHHEALLERPESAIRGLLDFCGLPFEADCLHPERGTGMVDTLSAIQVRKPLASGGDGVTTRYGGLLDSLRAALADG
jgi:tetratricopeptide (TPR) repeat protein